MNRYDALKNEIQNSDYYYQKLMIKIINQNKILINSISDTETPVNVTSWTKKDFLSGNEQFLMLLFNLIYRLKKDFDYLFNEKYDFIIEQIVADNQYNKYLLCKYYIGDNNFIPYFNQNYYTLVVHNFYQNIKVLSKHSKIIKKFANFLNLKFSQNEITQKNILLKLYNALKFIANNSSSQNNMLLLFKHINDYEFRNSKKYIFDSYIEYYEKIIINNYYNGYYKKNDL